MRLVPVERVEQHSVRFKRSTWSQLKHFADATDQTPGALVRELAEMTAPALVRLLDLVKDGELTNDEALMRAWIHAFNKELYQAGIEVEVVSSEQEGQAS